MTEEASFWVFIGRYRLLWYSQTECFTPTYLDLRLLIEFSSRSTMINCTKNIYVCQASINALALLPLTAAVILVYINLVFGDCVF